jgi:hypothetical protein
MKDTKFYTYNQNNSYGEFDIIEEKGIGIYVIIEANNANHANEIAENIGIYFNGILDGTFVDCTCCSCRWSEVTEDEAYNEPRIENEPLPSKDDKDYEYYEGVTFIHYLDKRIEKY